MIDFIECKNIKARIDHFCHGCGRRILIGERTEKHTLKDYEIYHLYYCMGCVAHVNLKCSDCNDCFNDHGAVSGHVRECNV